MNRMVRTRLSSVAAVCAVLGSGTGWAGQNPVTTVPMVFIPPFTGLGAAAPVLGAESGAASGAGAGAASGAGAGAVAGTDAEQVVPAAVGATEETEGAVVSDTASRITQVVELCRDLPDKAYTIDCVAAGLAEIAAGMPRSADQAAARAAIAEAARSLRSLATENRDPSLPRATVRRGNVATPRPVVPVQLSEETSSQAAAIIAEAQTILLRSAPSAEAAPAYNRISAALDTTRVLLRSS